MARSKMSAALLAGAALLAVSVVSSISGTAYAIGHAALARTSPAAPRTWRRVDLKAVTQPAAVGNRFVFYVAKAGGLQVVALDARSGSTVWADAASPSGIAPGQPPQLAVIGTDVFYLGKASGSVVELVARSVSTGHLLWHSAAGAFASWPSVCPDRLTAICLTGLLTSGSRPGVQLRFDARTGGQLPGALISPSSGGRELASGLFDPGRRTPELIVATSGGKVSWSRPIADLFPLPGASTDWGWNFDRVGRLGLYIGSPGWKPRIVKGRYVADLSRSGTAGFRLADGAVVWRSPGTYVCNYLPCPGAPEAGVSTASTATGSSPTVGLRTREVGTVSGTATQLPVASANARVTVEGFNPATGRTLWRFDGGHDPGLITNLLLPARIRAHSIALHDARGRLVALDLTNGSAKPIAIRAAGWCRSPILYKQNRPYPAANGQKLSQYIGQFAIFPCTANQVRLPTPTRVPNFISAIGAHADGLICWTDTKAVIAVPATP